MLASTSAPGEYQRREPQRTILYEIVRRHAQSTFAEVRARHPLGYGLPAFVEHEFMRYLDCGILARGFVRVHCGSCGHDRLVAFSCKGRGLCPSCTTRRHCDKCGNGYRSSFKANSLGLAASVLRAAGSIFGGGLAQAGWGADQLKDALRGSAWDDAFREAIDEIKPKFHQCRLCGRWVCPEVCWNAKKGLCEACAPDLQETAAAAQAQVGAEQIRVKAREHDQTGGADLKQEHVAACPSCNATLQPNAKFCASCGKPVGAATRAFCSVCGAKLAPNAKFCAECGQAQSSPS